MLNSGFRATVCAGFLVFVFVLMGCAQAPADRATGVQRMYVFNCGEAQVPDLSPWSPGFNGGKAAIFSDNCYLIVHGDDLMLWDAGYSDAIATKPAGVAGPRSTAFVKKTLAAQMAELGIKPGRSRASRSRTCTRTTSATRTCSPPPPCTCSRRNTMRRLE